MNNAERVPGSGMKAGTTTRLSQKQKKFVEEYLANGGDAANAYSVAYDKPRENYTRQRLSSGGYQVMKVKSVQDEIARRRKYLEQTTHYRMKEFMAETMEAMDFARRTDNATAFVRAVELRGKAHGHMVEKHEHSVSGFNLNIGGIGLPDYAKPQEKELPPPQEDESIDAEFKEIGPPDKDTDGFPEEEQDESIEDLL